MKWKMTSDGKCMIPDLSKNWKTRWFVSGIIFGFYAPLFARFYYKRKMPTFPTVKKVAIKCSVPGAFIGMVVQWCLLLLFKL